MAKLGALLGLPETSTSPVSVHDSDMDENDGAVADADAEEAGELAEAMDADLDADNDGRNDAPPLPSANTDNNDSTDSAASLQPPPKKVATKAKANAKSDRKGGKSTASSTKVDVGGAHPAGEDKLATAKKARASTKKRKAASAAPKALKTIKQPTKNIKKKQAKGNANSQNSNSGNIKVKKAKKQRQTKKHAIAISGLDPSDRDCVMAAIRHVRGAALSTEVDENTTHVVASGKRTIKVLSGIACGCKLVSPGWAMASLEAGEWLDEADHLLDAFPSASASTASGGSSHSAGKAKRQAIFSGVGLIYVSRTRISPSQPIILQLLTQSSAAIAPTLKSAAVRVGGMAAPEDSSYVSVNEKWIFDSITEQKAMPLKDYAIVC